MNHFLTVTEVAIRAQVSVRTIYRQVAAGSIPAPIKVTPEKGVLEGERSFCLAVHGL